MSGSESMSPDSPESDSPNARPFIALGFHRALFDPAGNIKKEEDHITREKGTDRTNPLEMSPGTYMIVLHLKYDVPKEYGKPDGTIELEYPCKDWHFKSGGEKANPGNDKVEIRIVFDTGSPSGKEPRYWVTPSEESITRLGTVELKPMQMCEVMAIGNVHHIFLDGENLLLQKYSGNLKYYIQVK